MKPDTAALALIAWFVVVQILVIAGFCFDFEVPEGSRCRNRTCLAQSLNVSGIPPFEGLSQEDVGLVVELVLW